MKHQEILEDLGALHDNELPPERKVELIAHLDGCAECRESYHRWGKIAQTFFPVQEKATPAQTNIFTRQLMLKFRNLEKPVALHQRLPLWNWVAPALSLSFAALLVFAILGHSDYSPPLDALLLVDAQDRDVAEFVLPSASSQEKNLLSSVLEKK